MTTKRFLLIKTLLCLLAVIPASQIDAGNPDSLTIVAVRNQANADKTTMGSENDPGRSYVLIEADIGYLILGIVFVAMGLITLLLTILRAASRDATIFLFGAMSLVWGIRFLLYTRIVPQLLAGEPLALQHLARSFTYFSASAAFGFTLAYLGPGWCSSLRILAFVSLAFSCGASLVLLVNPDRDLLLPTFNVMVLVGVVTILLNTLHPDLRPQIRQQGLLVGVCASVMFIVLENLRALGIVPIPWDMEWIGVLILYLTLGRLIAVRMFTNERRLAAISQELATAQQIQASLLPCRAPQIPGVAMAARFVPMTEVAGDIYDYVQVGDHCQGVLIADVSGHGVPAALIASMVKGAFRAQIENIEEPDRVLTGMNLILTGQLDSNFVTASCTFMDMEKGILRYAAAAHPPLLIQQPGAELCTSLEKNGLMLGQFPEATYHCVQRKLAGGDRLLLYTDGIIEACNSDGEEFGMESLQLYLNRNHAVPVEKFADGLLKTIGSWTDLQPSQSLDDDLTMVVIDILDHKSPV